MSSQQPLHADFDDLESYFTDVEHLREFFRQAVASPTLPKRLMIIHGVGGIGKSSLLRMFRLHCKRERIPVALASGDEEKSAVEVLARWADDLKADDVTLPSFSKALKHRRNIEAKVAEQANKRAKTLGKEAVKTLGEAAASAIPVIGPFISKLGGLGSEALVDWMGGFLKKPDIDLLLDPAKTLTDAFLTDVAEVAPNRRLVLMLDTFEQMPAQEEWTRDLAQRLHQNVPLIIAGRGIPDWKRHWRDWHVQAEVDELKPMTDEVMRELVHRYYAKMRGGEANPAQVDAIIRFARGLPLVVTSAVQLWVEHEKDDFQVVKPKVVADLVDRLVEGVPQEFVPVLEAAATVRWFNKEILRAVTAQENVNTAYDELRKFPFVRPRVEGLALHDVIREIMDENLKVQDPECHRVLHERAARFFENRLGQATGEEAERLVLELLYHRILAVEKTGIQLFQETAEELVRYSFVNRLRGLLNDVNTYPLEFENSKLWRKYYNARLAHITLDLSAAEEAYQAVSKDNHTEQKLRAYALCDWGEIWVESERIGKPEGFERALELLESSLRLAPEMDSKLAIVYSHLCLLYANKGDWQKAVIFLEDQMRFLQQKKDKYGIVNLLGFLKLIYGLAGYWKLAYTVTRKGFDIIKTLPENPSLRSRLLSRGVWVYLWSGHYAEAEQALQERLNVAQQVGDAVIQDALYKNLGFVFGLQGKYQRASLYFTESITGYQKLGSGFVGKQADVLGFWGYIETRQGKLESAKERLNQSLSIKLEVSQYNLGIPELLIWLGELHEVKASQVERATRTSELNAAQTNYSQLLNEYRWAGRRHFECGALTGLVRVKYAQNDFAAIPPLIAEAEQLAQQYEYNDHLASLRLTQGHMAWDDAEQDGILPYNAALAYYQHALIYALRFNRFLLDEVLGGRPQGTPLHPIIPHCLERGDEGRRMLEELRDWWKAGRNDIGAPRPDTISPIPENIPLLEGERTARGREPGDGTPQQTVVERIEQVLSGT